MKTKFNLLMVVMLFIGITATAQDSKTEKFKVYGNCGMCKSRIEKAAKSVEGVSLAEWDKETSMVSVTFDADKVELHKIHMAIAKVGHDTDMHKSDDKVYGELPGCCLYDRPEAGEKEGEHKGHKH